SPCRRGQPRREGVEMSRSWDLALLLSALLPAALPAAPLSWSPKAAATYLDGRAGWWLDWSGAARGQGTACLSCHTARPFALARPALRERLGEPAPAAVEQKLLDGLKKRVENWGRIIGSTSNKDPFLPFYSGGRKASALGTEAVLNALVLVHQDARATGG